MKITAHRAKQIEATIRRLRNHPDLWGDAMLRDGFKLV
jgi:hypothetical protein